MAAIAALRICHVLPQRVRLQWFAGSNPAALDQLCDQLACQPWLRALHRREASRSLVLELQPGCPEVRWPLALAALGWQVLDAPKRQAGPPGAASGAEGPGWDGVVRQMGGSMIGAVMGQILVGGPAAALGGVLFGPTGAWLLGGSGAVLGSVMGAILGGSIAEGETDRVARDLGQLTWRKLGTRLGEEAGSTSGMAMGAALAGPAGAVAGLALGSMIGGQLASDWTDSASRRQGIGGRPWLTSMVQEQSGEGLSQALAARIGAGLTGGSEAGRQAGASLGLRLGRKIDWSTSIHQHRLVPRSRVLPGSAQSPAQTGMGGVEPAG